MFTPASERLEQLFADKRLPARPETVVPKTEQLQTTIAQRNQGVSVTATKQLADEVQNAQLPDHGVHTDSDDEDEYASAFAKQPEMKHMPTKAALDDELGGVGRASNRLDDVAGAIEYIPKGKMSMHGVYPDEKDVNDENEHSHPYGDDEQALLGQYCVFGLLAKFPYKYMKDPDDRVSKRFFASNKFYERKWTLHYIYPPQSFSKVALLLVPLAEAEKLVNEISSAFSIDMSVPPPPFLLNFYDDQTPQPIFLGISTSRQEVNELTQRIPTAPSGYGDCPSTSSVNFCRAYEAYRHKIEAAVLANKSKSTGSRQKKTKKLFQTLQDSHNQLKRVQRYFGLRPRTTPAKALPNPSWDDDQLHQRHQQKSCGLFINFYEPGEVAPYAFDYEPIIIAIDVESYERNHGFVTEIGISMLDTLDLVSVKPGVASENWTKHIRSRHFRIRGREHLTNTEFCVGNPDAFKFGTSEFVSLDMVPEEIDSCFEWPFCVNFKRQESDTTSNQIPASSVTGTAAPTVVQKGPKERNLVLLGHNIGADLDYLRNLGSEIFGPMSRSTSSFHNNSLKTNRHLILASIIETLDTATLYQTHKNEAQPRSLGHVCASLGIDTWFLHNAGNDARYTLEALVRLAIAARVDEDDRQRLRDPTSTGVVEDEWEAEDARRVDERIAADRAKLERKLAALSLDPPDGPAVPESPPSERSDGPQAHVDGVEDAEIDWSVPIKGEKVSKRTKKHKT